MATLEGIKLNLGGKEFIVPPLNMKALRVLGPKFVSLTKAVDGGNLAAIFDGAQLDTMLEVLHAALVRNYPALTVEDLEELVDLGNLEDLFGAVCAQSGMKKTQPGGAGAPKRR